VVIELSAPGALEALKDKPFTIKEGATFRIKVVFQVHHEVLSGLKYLQVVKRKGIRVSKDEEMLVSLLLAMDWRIWTCVNPIQGSYAPNTTDKQVYEKKCKPPARLRIGRDPPLITMQSTPRKPPRE
jgi:Rho GDP-dissociation inhibitor